MDSKSKNQWYFREEAYISWKNRPRFSFTKHSAFYYGGFSCLIPIPQKLPDKVFVKTYTELKGNLRGT